MSNKNAPADSSLRSSVARTATGVVLVAAVAIGLVTITFFLRGLAVPVASAQERAVVPTADVGDNDGVENSPWGEAVNGLQFRLRAERLTWQSWQRPVVVLDVRNTSKDTIPAEKLQSLLTLQRHHNGPLLLHKPTKKLPEDRLYDREVQVDADVQSLSELKPGDSVSLPMAIDSASQSFDSGLKPDQIEIGLGHMRPPKEAEFYTNFLALRILPPGVRTSKEFDTLLKKYKAEDQPIEAAFIPQGTTLVEGERLIVTFVVRNPGDKLFSYGFGGDYRGANRHNRFKIEVHDKGGKLLPDPANRFGDFGGLLMARRVEPSRLTTETLDLEKYRTFSGPGRYTVSARFDLTNDFGTDGQFNVPVETKYSLTILPRTAENMGAVLKRQFARCEQSSGQPLEATIDILCEFGKEAAVSGLARLAREGTLARRRAAIRGLGKIPVNDSLAVLLVLEKEPQVRVAALRSLGSFNDDRAIARAVQAIGDQDTTVRTAAAEALGRMKSDTPLNALLERFKVTKSNEEKSVVLAALGESGGPKAFDMISQSLGHDDDKVRKAAVSAIVRFDAPDAAKALLPYAEDADMNFRESVIRTLAETLKQPIKAEWLSPVIRSRRGTNTIGDAPRLLRLYTDDKAAPTLLSCLDFDNPSIRNYYNMVLIQDQLACRTGLAIHWIGDLNRDGTPEELQQNRDTLARIKAWLKHYETAPWTEPPQPWRLASAQEERTWGLEVGGVRIRAHLNGSVWPQGLPQVVIIEALGKSGGSIRFEKRLEILELEVNDQWYAHDPAQEPKVAGEWWAYKGNAQQSFQLTENWKRVLDGQPLTLAPGPYKLRLRLVPPPGVDRNRLVTTPAVTFKVVSTE